MNDGMAVVADKIALIQFVLDGFEGAYAVPRDVEVLLVGVPMMESHSCWMGHSTAFEALASFVEDGLNLETMLPFYNVFFKASFAPTVRLTIFVFVEEVQVLRGFTLRTIAMIVGIGFFRMLMQFGGVVVPEGGTREAVFARG